MTDQINEASEQLESAFHLFNQFSEKLADSYGDLEAQVDRLSKELANERSARLVQLAEKEKLAKRLESLFDALPAGVIVLDAEGRITQTNRNAHEMLDFESNDKSFNKQWEKVAANNIVSDGDELRLKDGRWISLSASQLNDDSEKIILISNVSETHALHEMLNRQQRLTALGEMIAGLAHQVRTPLTSALLNISNANHPANDEDRRLYFTDKAKERLLHLEHMVNDMLVFARGDVSDAEYLNADGFITQLKKLLLADYKSQNISFHLDNSLSGVTIKANHDVLISAILNIVDNAIDASNMDTSELLADEGMTNNIEITAFLNNENKFEINVKDHGCGMTETTIKKVLEPFFTTRSSGTGLGLAVVNATVNRYNGEIRIKSTQGKGSDFNIRFPRAQANSMLHRTLINTNKMSAQTNLKIAAHQEVAL